MPRSSSYLPFAGLYRSSLGSTAVLRVIPVFGFEVQTACSVFLWLIFGYLTIFRLLAEASTAAIPEQMDPAGSLEITQLRSAGDQDLQPLTTTIDAPGSTKIPSFTPFRLSTLAGSRLGHQDGASKNALFQNLATMGLDHQNRVWIAETIFSDLYSTGTGSHRIRRYDIRSGRVETISGGASAGFHDGPVLEARWNGPSGFAFDQGGVVYVADRLNHRIRQIDTNGVVSTLSGSEAGLRDGRIEDALFHLPMDVSLDEKGWLWVADFGNYRIRRISPQGSVETVAGGVVGFRDGRGFRARFSGPSSIVAANSGVAYVADWQNGAIRKVAENGDVTTIQTGLGFVERVRADRSGHLYALHAMEGSNHRHSILSFDGDGNEFWRYSPLIGFRDGLVGRAYYSRLLGDLVPLGRGERIVFSDIVNNRLRELELLETAELTILPISSLFTNRLTVSMQVDLPNLEIRYTIDGSVPRTNSLRYSQPISIDKTLKLRAQVFSSIGVRSPEVIRDYGRVYASSTIITPAWWRQFFGSDFLTDSRTPDHADPDGDGYTNLQEFLGFTHPLQSNSFPFSQKRSKDFDGDGRTDLLLQHSDGQVAAWFMNGETIANASSFEPSRSEFRSLRLVGTGDFNGDQQPDLIYQIAEGDLTGSMEIWTLNGVKMVESYVVEEAEVDPTWNVVGVGDYNFDGYPDVIGQNGAGEISVRLIRERRVIGRGTTTPSSVIGANGFVDRSWALVGNADLDRDGRMDLIFQRTIGLGRTLAVWRLNGLEQVETSLLQPSEPGIGWEFAGVGDFNGDEKDDILLQHPVEGYVLWYMNGISRLRVTPLTPSSAGPGWRIAGPK